MRANRARPTRFGTYESPAGLFLCAALLGPALLFLLAREDHIARGIRYTAGGMAKMITIAAAVFAAEGLFLFWFP